MKTTKPHWLLFVAQLFLYAGMLCLDLYLVEWYEDFYNAIQSKSQQQFYRELSIFIALTISQALLLALIAFNSEVFEAELKRYFVEKFIGYNLSKDFNIKQFKGDQKIIDDANLAAEKIAIISPALIFNSVKATIFLFLLSQYPIPLLNDESTEESIYNFGLSFFGFIYLIIQVLVVNRANSWIVKSENIKRSIEARTRYNLLSATTGDKSYINQIVKRYVRSGKKIQLLVARAHGLNVLSINSISSISFIVPFVAIFSAYCLSIITFGELMKISAIYSGFQSSAMYVFNTYKEIFKGVAAIKRLNTSY